MAHTPREADLRLTIPADASYHSLAGEVAEKFAEYSGAGAAAAANLARAVEVLAAQLAADGADASIALTMEARNGTLTVTAESGSTRERATIPLH
jgi:hypothetical protein